MLLYKTVKGTGYAELQIDRSRFISRVIRSEKREEAERFFSDIKQKHRDASHNVPAFVLGDKMQEQWASDDGEPNGTAGAPVLSVLTATGITNTAIIVTRYFGGIKLGTGGLIRAYTSVAKAAMENAGIAEARAVTLLVYESTYPAFEKIKLIAGRAGFTLSDVHYSEKLCFTAIVESDNDNEERVCASISDASLGSAVLIGSRKDVVIK